MCCGAIIMAATRKPQILNVTYHKFMNNSHINNKQKTPAFWAGAKPMKLKIIQDAVYNVSTKILFL